MYNSNVTFTKGDFDRSLKSLMMNYGPGLYEYVKAIDLELKRANEIELIQIAHCRKMIGDEQFEELIKYLTEQYFKDVKWEEKIDITKKMNELLDK